MCLNTISSLSLCGQNFIRKSYISYTEWSGRENGAIVFQVCLLVSLTRLGGLKEIRFGRSRMWPVCANNNFVGEKINGIQLNTNGIQLNTNGIQLNTNGIQLNTNGIQLNTNGIQLNTNGIQLNTKGIQLNTNGIQLNTNGIQLNTNALLVARK